MFPSMVRELWFQTSSGKNTETKNRNNIVTNSIKTLKMVYIEKETLKIKLFIVYLKLIISL